MHVIEIQDPRSGSRARIAVDQGFNCYQFLAAIGTGETVDVLAGGAEFEQGRRPPSHYGIPLLFPFPSRIRGGQYTWGGRQWTLPPQLTPDDGMGNAIHGFCFDRPWRVMEHTDRSVSATFQLSVDAPDRRPLWPADAVISVRYSLRGACLRADIAVTNPSSQPLPWGFGTHPYFRIPLSASSQPGHCTIYVPAAEEWQLQALLPTGVRQVPAEEARLIEAPYFDLLRLDNIYTSLLQKQGVATCRILDEQASLQVEQRSCGDFREIVAFTPHWTSAVCLEPYTCVADAINLQPQGVDAGLQVMPPGGRWDGWIEIEALPVLC